MPYCWGGWGVLGSAVGSVGVGKGGHVVECILLWRSHVCSCCPGRIIAELLMPYCWGVGSFRVGSWESVGVGTGGGM